MSRLLRAVVALAVMTTALVATPAPALAHTELLGTSPADAAVLTEEIDEVTLTFSGPVRADGSSVTITGPDGQSHNAGPLSVLDFVVHQPITQLASGGYQVAWTVLAGDGHPMTGQFAFQVSLPPELEPTPSPSSTSDAASASPSETADEAAVAGNESSPWWWIGAMIAAAAIIVVVLLARRRRDRPEGA